MQALKVIAIVVCAAMLSALLTGVAYFAAQTAKTDVTQSQLDAFYTPPSALPAPGSVIRVEPMRLEIPGGRALRMLYSSAHADGSAAASGAMVFIPDREAASSGRPVVAWAHGTVGQGDACAPSRSANPTSQLLPWLGTMMELGWLVVATDYTGLGTPGTELYLVGDQEARDVVTSVQAARSLPDVQASTSWSVFGHSQGGHSALWAGELASELAPDLRLVGVAAAAPAAELAQIVELQWDELAGWVIGAEVARSWPEAAPGLPIDGVLTEPALKNYERLAQECVLDATAESFARFNVFKQDFFNTNPLQVPAWSRFVEEQTPQPLPSDVPVFLAQGTLDTVVYAEPNLHLFTSWCDAGSTITPLFLATDHLQIAKLAAPEVISWLSRRFNGERDNTNCRDETPIGVTNQGSS